MPVPDDNPHELVPESEWIELAAHMGMQAQAVRDKWMETYADGLGLATGWFSRKKREQQYCLLFVPIMGWLTERMSRRLVERGAFTPETLGRFLPVLVGLCAPEGKSYEEAVDNARDAFADAFENHDRTMALERLWKQIALCTNQSWGQVAPRISAYHEPLASLEQGAVWITDQALAPYLPAPEGTP